MFQNTMPLCVPANEIKDVDNPASLDALPFNRGKREIADHLVKMVNSHKQTTWTALVSGPFLDWVSREFK